MLITLADKCTGTVGQESHLFDKREVVAGSPYIIGRDGRPHDTSARTGCANPVTDSVLVSLLNLIAADHTSRQNHVRNWSLPQLLYHPLDTSNDHEGIGVGCIVSERTMPWCLMDNDNLAGKRAGCSERSGIHRVVRNGEPTHSNVVAVLSDQPDAGLVNLLCLGFPKEELKWHCGSFLFTVG